MHFGSPRSAGWTGRPNSLPVSPALAFLESYGEAQQMVDKNVLNKSESGPAKSDIRPRWAEMEDPPAHFTVVGLSYKTAPIRVRELVSLSKEDLARALPMVSAQAGQSVILSTCDRTEVYSIVSDPAVGFDAVRHFLAEFHGLEPHAISPYMYEFSDVDAARHLHLVATGICTWLPADWIPW